MANGGDRAALQNALAQCQAQLHDDFACVARCNVGGEFMAEADMARLQALALTPWVRQFDNRLGLSESLRIMALMAKDRHIDTQLFRYFLHSRVWECFAQQYMLSAQIDAVDIAATEGLLPVAA